MEKTENTHAANETRRKILTAIVAQHLQEVGFISADKDCLQTLTEMCQALLIEASNSARRYCEHAGRTKPCIGDITVALVNMGITLQDLQSFAMREVRRTLPLPAQMTQQKPLNLLQAGTKPSHPAHIPSHLPTLPDPHAYVRTPTYKQPVTEYEAMREKSANQKRDMEKALTKFLARTTETISLFDTEDNMFPLIDCKPSFPSYLAALNPTDQVFDFEELEYHYLVANRTEDAPSKDDNDENDSGNDDADMDNSRAADNDAKPENDIKPNSATNKAILENPNIDNPYLRAATLPKRSKLDPMLAAAAARPITPQQVELVIKSEQEI